MQREVQSHGVSLRTELSSALPPVLGDRVQLQAKDSYDRNEDRRNDGIGHGKHNNNGQVEKGGDGEVDPESIADEGQHRHHNSTEQALRG